jgi:putative flippase GtrA
MSSGLPTTYAPQVHRETTRTAVPRLRRLVADRRIRYVLAGGLSAVIYYGAFSAGWLLWGRHVPYLVIAIIANAVAAGLTFPIYRRVVFQHLGPWAPAFVKFYLVYVWGLIFSLVGLPPLVEWAGLPVLLAQAVVIVATPVLNYQLHRIWAFRRRARSTPIPEDVTWN